MAKQSPTIQDARPVSCAFQLPVLRFGLLFSLGLASWVLLSRSRGEPRHDTPGENRALTSAQRTFNECGGFLLRSEAKDLARVSARLHRPTLGSGTSPIPPTSCEPIPLFASPGQLLQPRHRTLRG